MMTTRLCMTNGAATPADDLDLEALESEEADAEATPPAYEVVTYPADFTLEGLVAKLGKNEIIIPGFQRKFVWTQNRASKLTVRPGKVTSSVSEPGP